MPKRLVTVKNPGHEVHHPEIGYDEGKVDFDGQTYQFHLNPSDKRVVPDGTAVRESVKLDNTASTATYPDDNAES